MTGILVPGENDLDPDEPCVGFDEFFDWYLQQLYRSGGQSGGMQAVSKQTTDMEHFGRLDWKKQKREQPRARTA